MSRVTTNDPFWEAFRKVNRLKIQLTSLAQARDDEELWQLIELTNQVEGHLYEALRLRSAPANNRKRVVTSV